ncbi:phosphoribosyltransferase [Nostoc sp. UHCC 0702]|nr:phosphoribosyltransferase [Nostoc sp. UHCC 0702]
MTKKFRNRIEAGQMLAKHLTAYANRTDVLVLGLPRGGVPVAFEVAKALNVPLDICLVRKLGVPAHEELAMGAIASGGVRVLNSEVVDSLGIDRRTIDEVATQELQELQRRDRAYRGDRPHAPVKNRTVILIDDGIATSSTIRAAIAVLRSQQAQQIVVAVPVAPATTCEQLRAEVEEVICLTTPEPMYAIGLWYKDFSQTSDEEVRDLLAKRSAVISNK